MKENLPVSSRKNKIAKARLAKLRVKAGNAKRRGPLERRVVAEQRLQAALAS